MKYKGSIDGVEIDTVIMGIRLLPGTNDIEISFGEDGKLKIWRDSYVALGMPTVWDGAKIILKPQSYTEKASEKQ